MPEAAKNVDNVESVDKYQGVWNYTKKAEESYPLKKWKYPQSQNRSFASGSVDIVEN